MMLGEIDGAAKKRPASATVASTMSKATWHGDDTPSKRWVTEAHPAASTPNEQPFRVATAGVAPSTSLLADSAAASALLVVRASNGSADDDAAFKVKKFRRYRSHAAIEKATARLPGGDAIRTLIAQGTNVVVLPASTDAVAVPPQQQRSPHHHAPGGHRSPPSRTEQGGGTPGYLRANRGGGHGSAAHQSPPSRHHGDRHHHRSSTVTRDGEERDGGGLHRRRESAAKLHGEAKDEDDRAASSPDTRAAPPLAYATRLEAELARLEGEHERLCDALVRQAFALDAMRLEADCLASRASAIEQVESAERFLLLMHWANRVAMCSSTAWSVCEKHRAVVDNCALAVRTFASSPPSWAQNVQHTMSDVSAVLRGHTARQEADSAVMRDHVEGLVRTSARTDAAVKRYQQQLLQASEEQQLLEQQHASSTRSSTGGASRSGSALEQQEALHRSIRESVDVQKEAERDVRSAATSMRELLQQLESTRNVQQHDAATARQLFYDKIANRFDELQRNIDARLSATPSMLHPQRAAASVAAPLLDPPPSATLLEGVRAAVHQSIEASTQSIADRAAETIWARFDAPLGGGPKWARELAASTAAAAASLRAATSKPHASSGEGVVVLPSSGILQQSLAHIDRLLSSQMAHLTAQFDRATEQAAHSGAATTMSLLQSSQQQQPKAVVAPKSSQALSEVGLERPDPAIIQAVAAAIAQRSPRGSSPPPTDVSQRGMSVATAARRSPSPNTSMSQQRLHGHMELASRLVGPADAAVGGETHLVGTPPPVPMQRQPLLAGRTGGIGGVAELPLLAKSDTFQLEDDAGIFGGSLRIDEDEPVGVVPVQKNIREVAQRVATTPDARDSPSTPTSDVDLSDVSSLADSPAARKKAIPSVVRAGDGSAAGATSQLAAPAKDPSKTTLVKGGAEAHSQIGVGSRPSGIESTQNSGAASQLPGAQAIRAAPQSAVTTLDLFGKATVPAASIARPTPATGLSTATPMGLGPVAQAASSASAPTAATTIGAPKGLPSWTAPEALTPLPGRAAPMSGGQPTPVAAAPAPGGTPTPTAARASNRRDPTSPKNRLVSFVGEPNPTVPADPPSRSFPASTSPPSSLDNLHSVTTGPSLQRKTLPALSTIGIPAKRAPGSASILPVVSGA
mgnify:FL=1